MKPNRRCTEILHRYLCWNETDTFRQCLRLTFHYTCPCYAIYFSNIHSLAHSPCPSIHPSIHSLAWLPAGLFLSFHLLLSERTFTFITWTDTYIKPSETVFNEAHFYNGRWTIRIDFTSKKRKKKKHVRVLLNVHMQRNTYVRTYILVYLEDSLYKMLLNFACLPDICNGCLIFQSIILTGIILFHSTSSPTIISLYWIHFSAEYKKVLLIQLCVCMCVSSRQLHQCEVISCHC